MATFPAIITKTHQNLFFWHFKRITGSSIKIEWQIWLSDHFTSNNFSSLNDSLSLKSWFPMLPVVYLMRSPNTKIDLVMSLHILVQYRVHSHRWNQDHHWRFLKISWYWHFIITLSVNKIHPKLTVETDDHRFIFKIPIAQNQYCAGRNRRCWRSSCCRSGCCSRRCSCCRCCRGNISSRRGI